MARPPTVVEEQHMCGREHRRGQSFAILCGKASTVADSRISSLHWNQSRTRSRLRQSIRSSLDALEGIPRCRDAGMVGASSAPKVVARPSGQTLQTVRAFFRHLEEPLTNRVVDVFRDPDADIKGTFCSTLCESLDRHARLSPVEKILSRAALGLRFLSCPKRSAANR